MGNETEDILDSQSASEYEAFRLAVPSPAFWRSVGASAASSAVDLNGRRVETLAILAGFGPDGAPRVRVSQKVDGALVSVGTVLELPALLRDCRKALGLGG